MNFKNINTIINDYLNLTQYKGYINRADMKYKANRILKKLVGIEHSVHKIELIDIKDYRIQRPDEFQKLIQISFKSSERKKSTIYDIHQSTIKNYPKTGCDLKITKECNKCLEDTSDCNCSTQKMVVNVDRLLDLSHPEFRYRHMKWFHGYGGLASGDRPVSNYHNEFELIKSTSDPYFSIESHVKGCVNLLPIVSQSEVEYRLEPEVIRFNKKEGQIMLVYLAKPTDSEGYMLVPDVPDVYEAIKWYIEEEFRYAQWSNGDPSAKALYENAERKKLDALGRARPLLRQQSFTEMWKDLGKYYGKILPTVDHRGNSTDHYQTVMDRIYRNQ